MILIQIAIFLLFPLIGFALWGLWGCIGGIGLWVLLELACILHSMVTEPWKWRHF